MSIVRGIRNKIQRMTKMTWDLDYIQNVMYNDSSGAQKSITIEPVVKGVYTGGDALDFGAYIKVAAGTTAYTLDCIGKAHSASSTYRIGDIVTEAGGVYIAQLDIRSPKAFDANDWKRVADKQIAAIPVTGGAVVCTGRHHNAINVSGFVVDDLSPFGSKR